MFSFFKKHTEEITALFDVTSSSVGVTLVQCNTDGIPFILFSHRENFKVEEHVSSAHLLQSMLQGLKHAVAVLYEQGLKKLNASVENRLEIASIFCTFSSPWHISETKIITLNRDIPFVVSPSLIDTFLKKEEEIVNADFSQGKYDKIYGTKVQLLERKIIHTKINGYEVKNILGKKALDFEVTFFISYISDAILKQVERILNRVVHTGSIHYSSYSLSAWNATIDMFPGNQHFLFVDIGGEVSDIIFTSNGALMEAMTFPGGRSCVIRELMKQFAVSHDVATSYLKLYGLGSLEPVFSEKVSNAISQAAHAWYTAYSTKLTEFSAKHTIPKKVFVSSEADCVSIFQKVLAADPEREVIIMDESKIKPFVDIGSQTYFDAELAIEAVFANKILNIHKKSIH
jgi:hypothetical protein